MDVLCLIIVLSSEHPNHVLPFEQPKHVRLDSNTFDTTASHERSCVGYARRVTNYDCSREAVASKCSNREEHVSVVRREVRVSGV